ncbi:MAG: homoaconitate hydratase [Candidatus Aenigmarchaeota archaeon]|nr:homoaconitate hydratase [Candidatus Aenigmarchaeota archaeon]
MLGIHDTTLRDGEQMPGVVFSPNEKIILAKKVSDFGIDLIDIMPCVSETEARITKILTGLFGEKITATCRAKKSDVDTAISCGAERITLFAPVSDIHIKNKLGTTREKNIENSIGMIDYAKSHGLKVDFAGEDSTRADISYLLHFINSVEKHVETFFVADTLGCLTPHITYQIISLLKNTCSCRIGIHAHNDFGMATANTLEAIMAGADIFSGTFTGIGERSGNAPIEEVCLALKFTGNAEINVKYGMLKDICDDVEMFSGVSLQAHKPIIGKNSFCHESGIHVDGILKDPRTYENFDPSIIGQKRSFMLGKHSGKKLLRKIMGEDVSKDVIEQTLRKIKAISEVKKVSFSEDDFENLSLAGGKVKM